MRFRWLLESMRSPRVLGNILANSARIATHCNTLQCTATQCNTLQHTRVNALTCCLGKRVCKPRTHCNTLHHTAPHCTTLHHTAQHCTTLHHTVPHCTTLHRTATHCNALQYTVQFSPIFAGDMTHDSRPMTHS